MGPGKKLEDGNLDKDWEVVDRLTIPMSQSPFRIQAPVKLLPSQSLYFGNAETSNRRSQHFTSISKDLVAYAKDHNRCIGFRKSDHNCGYYCQVLFKEDVNFRSRSCSTNKRADKLKELIEICYKNLLHAQKL